MRRSANRTFINLLVTVALAATAMVAATSVAGADERLASRLAGPDRYATAVAVSRTSWPGGSDVVFLVAAGEFADALSIGAVAPELGPVLLADRDRLPPATVEELRRLAPVELVVVGGPRAISDQVMEAAARYARTTGRVAGSDRFATSVEVARAVGGGEGLIYVANGGSYETAILGSVAAGKAGAPLLLVSSNALPAVVERYLAEVRPERVVLVGDARAISDSVSNQIRRYTGAVDRIAGVNHAATAAAASRSDHRISRRAVVATQAAFPDALTGGPFAVRSDAPLLLVQPDRVPVETACEIGRLGVTELVVLGGPLAVSDAVVQQLRDGSAVSGAACERLFVPMTGAPLHEGVFDAAGEHLFVVNQQGNQVEVIDRASGTHLRSIWVGADPVDIDITRDGRYLYVTHVGSHDVLVVDVPTGAWVGPRIRLPRHPGDPESDRARAFTLAIDARENILFSDTKFDSEDGGGLWTLTHGRWLDAHRSWSATPEPDDEAYITPSRVSAAFDPPSDGAKASRLVRSADRSVIGLLVSNLSAPDFTECENRPPQEDLAEDSDVESKEECIERKQAESERAGLLIWNASRQELGTYAREWGETVSNLAFDPSGRWAVVHGDGETTFVVNVADVFSGDRLALRGTVTSSGGAEGMAVGSDTDGCLVAWRLVDGESDGGDGMAALEVLQIQQHDANVGRCRDRYLPARDASGRPLVVPLDDLMPSDGPRLNEVDLTRSQLVISPGGSALAAMTENGVQILRPPLA